MMNKFSKLSLVLLISCFSIAHAAEVKIKVYSTDATPKLLGTVVAKDSKKGLVLIPHLKDLPPGPHGFHIHDHPNCADHGMGAAGHLDPKNTGKHLGPYNEGGHLGDLPVLVVNTKGVANQKELAPHLTVADIKGHSLMIHADGDNYSDTPKPLGGGGARIACGVIP
jgi:Cu-Zn family superoxide dismutase